METISLAMIVKNEEKTLDNCLSSICDLVDEIIIVDTGSSDKTKEIARKYTNNIYDFEWVDDFAKARNYAFSKATCDLIMWLDADDILLPEDQRKFRELRSKITDDMTHISMIYNCGKNKFGEPILSFRRNRIVKNIHKDQWRGFIHEYLDYNIETSYKSEVEITHTANHSHGTRNLDIYLKKYNEGVEFDARNCYYFGTELMNNNRLEEAIGSFEKCISKVGTTWIEDIINAHIQISECKSRLGLFKDGREILFKCLEYTRPRVSIYYRIGCLFMEDKRWYDAIYYFEEILKMDVPKSSSFVNNEEYTWKPRLQLCVCYYNIGDSITSRKYNKDVLDSYPDLDIAINNEKFFKNLLDGENN